MAEIALTNNKLLSSAFHLQQLMEKALNNPFDIRARYPEYKDFVSTSLNQEIISGFMNIGQEVLEW